MLPFGLGKIVRDRHVSANVVTGTCPRMMVSERSR